MPRSRSSAKPAVALTLHGVFMRVDGLGVLLTGASGVGKSELALELLNRGHQLVADDAADFGLSATGRLLGRCPPLLRGFLEARSLGILNVRRLYGKRAIAPPTPLDLVIALDAPGPSPDVGLERLTGRRSERDILGKRVPEISIPIRLGHNLAVLVEAACRDLKLRRRGYRADEDLSHRQLAAIHRSSRPIRRPARS